MKPVSTGTGLCVLSATIAACFGVSRLESDGKAIAAPPMSAGQQTAPPSQTPHGAPPQWSGTPGGTNPRGMTATQGSSASMPRLAPDASCLGEPQQWFDPTPQVFAEDCGLVTVISQQGNLLQSNADLNSDGTQEFFYRVASGGYLRQVLNDGVPVDPGFLLAAGNYEMTDAGSALRAFPVMGYGLITGTAINAMISLDPTLSDWTHRSAWLLDINGFRDFDGDGSLDLAMTLVIDVWNDDGEGIWSYPMYWFKNTGCQKASAPNPYDHDGDGHVNTADLSLMLLEFTD